MTNSLRCTLAAAAILAAAHSPAAETAYRVPPENVFPALGAPSHPKVEIAWNRYYDVDGLNGFLRALAAAHPDFARVVKVGESHQGREILALEVTNYKVGDPATKPAMYIDGNIHGNEVQAGEVVLHTAWYLLEMRENVERVGQLLDNSVFYLLPSINPDGRDYWFDNPNNPHTSRGGQIPTDNDLDGLVDEDGPEDLDGDGQITQMRRRTPFGTHKPDPQFPDRLMVRVGPDERGEFEVLGTEGIDNDGDGEVNEDGPGGYDPNRNWAWDWQPEGVQGGAHRYPFSLPETRAVRDYVLARPNIAAAQSYHNAGGMILSGPGREGAVVHDGDASLYKLIGERGEQMLPAYDYLITWKDLYTVWGGELEWFYGGLGILCYTNELWSNDNLHRTPDPDANARMRFVRDVLLDQGFTAWTTHTHPQYGEVEVGGTHATFGRVPPSFLLEEEMHRNTVFTLFHAEQMPRLSIGEVAVERLGRGLSRVRADIVNDGLTPTRLQQDVENKITPANSATITGRGLKVLASGIVTDRDHGRVDFQHDRPERLRVDAVPGNGRVTVEFIVSGDGKGTLRFEAMKGGLAEKEFEVE
ncbi:MAG: M14 family metallopeptidase [Candidatus Sumerlaeia bacterium]|nr:M14 family metallopeptidase [Candidatus Sumerlaeia bacterium]